MFGFASQETRAATARGDQDDELENMHKQHELLKRMVEQREQLRALQGRQKALMAMQESAEQVLAVIEDTGESAGQYCLFMLLS